MSNLEAWAMAMTTEHALASSRRRLEQQRNLHEAIGQSRGQGLVKRGLLERIW
jgi:hypothetical protein